MKILFVLNYPETLRNLKLPDWLTPGSPTPLEMGIHGINDALGDLIGTIARQVKKEKEDLLLSLNTARH